MKRVFKNFLYMGIICPVILLSSCTKLKDTNYSDLVSSQFQISGTEVGALLGAAYGSWRDVIFPSDWSEGLWLVQETCSDQLCIPQKPYGWVDGGKHRRMHEHKWTVDDSYVSSVWWPSYQGITNCNRVIAQVESLSLDETVKESLLAEVKVLRASFYWVLCDNFGNVPIMDKFDVPEGYLPKQSNRKEVYDFIVKEITEAIPHLGDKNDATIYARFNSKGAANALLAKVYLNAEVYTGVPRWEECLAACDAIITSGNYVLEANQKDVFRDQNQNSKEIIFSVPYDVIYTSNDDGVLNLMFDYTLPSPAQSTFDLKQQPWGGIVAIPQFISTYHPNDKRLTEGWLFGQQYTSSGVPIKCTSGLTDSSLNIRNELPGIDSSQEFHGYVINKYEIVQNGYTDICNNDFVVLRYADVLMMKAECMLRTNKPGAGQLVTQVRLRSFPGNPGAATVSDDELKQTSAYSYGLRNFHTTTNDNAVIPLGRFYDELGWEFVGEGHRRQDMIRFGLFTTKSWLSHSPGGTNKTIFPIPLDELNKNINIKQNPGY
jgi:starch-binding outer membrane protein, SusD/RagB family